MRRPSVQPLIVRFLKILQRARRMPNRRELFWLRHALVNVQEGQYPAGEDAMDKAERVLPIPEHLTNDPSNNATVNVEQLQSSRNGRCSSRPTASRPKRAGY